MGVFGAGLCLLLAGALSASPDPALRAVLVESVGVPAQELTFRTTLERFYSFRGFEPVWYRAGDGMGKAVLLIDTLQNADREGLVPEDYLADHLASECRSPGHATRGRCELLLSESLLRYARDVGSGRHDPAALDTQWHIETAAFEPLSVLQTFADTAQTEVELAALPPHHPAYAGLRQLLSRYRALADLGGWPLIGEGPTLRPGMVHPDVVVLRRRLAMEFPQSALAVDNMRYDTGVEAAVRRFQKTRGLDVDGLAGPMTRRALAVPARDLVAQIRLNMERWRWLPSDLGQRHLLVNLPAFELYLVEGGRPVIRMRAITGRTDRSSPSFASRVTKVVFNPDWTIPLVISVEDILPRQQQDPGYLLSRNIQALRSQGGEFVEVDSTVIDWSPYHKDRFPFILRQAPGPTNSLGQIKFLMPNRFDIYLHDTPAKALFHKSVRTLSSGCIRVQQPLQLAGLLLAPDSGDEGVKFRRLVEQGETRVVELPAPVPVYLVYLTAWAEPDGEAHFRDDVYGRDNIMMPAFRDLD